MYNSNGKEKNPEVRQRRNQETYVIDFVEWDGVVRGPDLPPEVAWSARTNAWWEMWRRSPQSMLMVDLDWEEMLITAKLYNTYWGAQAFSTGTVLLAAEIRQRTSKFGATYEDRKKLRMSLDTPMSDMKFQEEVEDVYVDYKSRISQPKTPKPLDSATIKAAQERNAPKTD